MTSEVDDKAPISRRAKHTNAVRGAPRGTGLADQLRKELEPHKPQVIAKLIELAEAGDSASMRLFMERVSPPLRTEGERVVLPELVEAESLADKAQVILDCVASGRCSIEAGKELMGLLEIVRRSVMHDELDERVTAIEEGRKPAKELDGVTVVDADGHDITSLI
jgi:hypothetical protein